MVPFQSPIPTLFLVLVSCTSISASERLYLGDHFGQVVMEIDIVSGNRRIIEMEDYPTILSARNPYPDGPGTFLFAAFDAVQRSAVYRYHLSNDTYTGVSGFTDYNSVEPQGMGRDPNIGFRDWVFTPVGTLLGLHTQLGPMEIDLESGDRRLLASEIAPVTGANPPMLEALDLVLESSGSVLVADRFQGIFRMNRTNGELRVVHPGTDFLSSPYNIERIPDGRLLHCLSQGDHGLYLFDPTDKSDRLLSSGGPFPVGGGTPFVSVWDIAMGPGDEIYVYDIGIPAVFEVALESGDRTLISGEARGEGPPLLADFNKPTLSAENVPPPKMESASWWFVY